MKFKSLVLGLSLLFSVHSYSAVLIEPVLGYNLGSKTSFKSFDNVSGEDYTGGSGVGYGGRLGYQNFGFQLGLDYLASSIDMDDKDFKNNLSTSEWAAFVGFRFPVLLRVYAGYIFAASGETKDGDGEKVEFSGGSGFKAGLGWTLLPLLDLNLEYRKTAYEDYKWGGSKLNQEVDMSSWFLSISVPLTI